MPFFFLRITKILKKFDSVFSNKFENVTSSDFTKLMESVKVCQAISHNILPQNSFGMALIISFMFGLEIYSQASWEHLSQMVGRSLRKLEMRSDGH